MDDAAAKNMSDFTMAASGLICDEPCWLYSLELAENNNSHAQIKLYDGQNTEGKVRTSIRSNVYLTASIVYNVPKFFSKGLYIELADGSADFNGQFLKHRYKKEGQ